uniref:ABC transporter domain-containing protein n=1 Tax=Ditylenchus dipsaci TaxID=166011 RepID=A0A915DJ63_9BILA
MTEGLDPSEWRRMIGSVGQEPVLFSSSIRENICYGAPNPEAITDEQVKEAAIQSNCYEFIQTFPDKFDTPVGEQGASMLSGGQKQRIAIARALITVRTALNNLLKNNRQTVLIIAHRLSTVKHANQIVVLDKGTIAERELLMN